MAYTEKLELRIIDDSDPISRSYANENMNKIDAAFENLQTDVAEAVASVSATKTEIEEENAAFKEKVEHEIDEKVDDFTAYVNGAVASYPMYLMAGQLNTGANYQIAGQTGNDYLPLSLNEFMRLRGIQLNGTGGFRNMSYAPTDGSGAPRYVKLSVNMIVVTTEEGTPLSVYLTQHTPAGNQTIKKTIYNLKVGSNEINFTAIFNMNSIDGSSSQYKLIGFDCPQPLILENKASITIEYVGV